MPLLENCVYLDSLNENLKERAGFFKLSSDHIHLFTRALVADNLIAIQDSEKIVSCISTSINKELSLEEIEAFLPDPLADIIKYLRKYFWLDKPLYTIIPGLENTSLVSLLSLCSSKAEYILVPYKQQYDTKLLSTVTDILENSGKELLLQIPKLTYQTAHLLQHTQEIWIGPEADLQALLKLRFLQPAVERELELYKKIVVGSEGHYIIEDLDIEWIEKKPYRILVKEPSEIDYLSLVFGKDKVSRVAALLSELIKSSSLTEKNFFDLIRDLG
ncbi:MAG: hypothetical protein DRJ52_08665, partial [Thermoprotei archaeon]